MSSHICISPDLLNQHAWSQRWTDRQRSIDAARTVLRTVPEDTAAGAGARGLALRTLAWQRRYQGQLKQARTDCEAAIPLLARWGPVGALADAETTLGAILKCEGRNGMARDQLHFAERHVMGHALAPETRAEFLCTKASVLGNLGQSDAALDVLDAALDVAEGPTVTQVFYSIAQRHFAAGRLEKAGAGALRAVASARRWRNFVILPHALCVLAGAHRLGGRFERAAECLDEARRIAIDGGDICAQCKVIHEAGVLRLTSGHAREAVRILETGNSLGSRMGYVLRQFLICKDLAQAYETLGDFKSALDAMKTVDRMREQAIA